MKKKRVVRISKDGTITLLHADDVDLESVGEVRIKRATDVYYETGKGWTARCVHPAFQTQGHTQYRKKRVEAIRDEEVLLNDALRQGTVNVNAI